MSARAMGVSGNDTRAVQGSSRGAPVEHAPRLVKPDGAGPDLSAFTDEQRAQLLALHEAIARRASRFDRVCEALYRACISVAREVKPEKRWDVL
jgi:hypothetical protein